MQIAKIKNNELVLYCLQIGTKIASFLFDIWKTIFVSGK